MSAAATVIIKKWYIKGCRLSNVLSLYYPNFQKKIEPLTNLQTVLATYVYIYYYCYYYITKSESPHIYCRLRLLQQQSLLLHSNPVLFI